MATPKKLFIDGELAEIEGEGSVTLKELIPSGALSVITSDGRIISSKDLNDDQPLPDGFESNHSGIVKG